MQQFVASAHWPGCADIATHIAVLVSPQHGAAAGSEWCADGQSWTPFAEDAAVVIVALVAAEPASTVEFAVVDRQVWPQQQTVENEQLPHAAALGVAAEHVAEIEEQRVVAVAENGAPAEFQQGLKSRRSARGRDVVQSTGWLQLFGDGE